MSIICVNTYHCISLAPGPHGKSDSEWISSLSSLTILMEENQFFDSLDLEIYYIIY